VHPVAFGLRGWGARLTDSGQRSVDGRTTSAHALAVVDREPTQSAVLEHVAPLLDPVYVSHRPCQKAVANRVASLELLVRRNDSRYAPTTVHEP
jgi:hypothetical protein